MLFSSSHRIATKRDNLLGHETTHLNISKVRGGRSGSLPSPVPPSQNLHISANPALWTSSGGPHYIGMSDRIIGCWWLSQQSLARGLSTAFASTPPIMGLVAVVTCLICPGQSPLPQTQVWLTGPTEDGFSSLTHSSEGTLCQDISYCITMGRCQGLYL